jgi:hypothetical protein
MRAINCKSATSTIDRRFDWQLDYKLFLTSLL